MKRAKFWIAVICAFTAFNVYADSGAVEPTQSDKQEHQSQSLYESIKSGWNKMLDVVVGPETPDNENNDN